MEATKFCQSCGMPITEELYGKNQDGTGNEEYCKYCFDDGKFTAQQTMEQMIESCIPFMVKEGMAEAEARQMMEEQLPQLKRWQKA